MPSTPFDNGHQESLRDLIGKVLPDAGAQHIAEAVAAGYGYRTQRAFMKAIRAVEAGGLAPVYAFDTGRLIDRLQALGEAVGKQEEALRFLLTLMAHGPRSGPRPEQDAPDEAEARQYLRKARLYMEVGLWQDAGTILGTAMGAAPASLKGEVAAALEQAAPHAEIAATNFALALIFAHGVPRDLVRAGALLERLTQAQDPEVRGDAHNWLGHIASGRLGGSPAPAVAVAHFEQAARLGYGEAAFNAGLLYESGNGVLPSAENGREDPANEVWLDKDVRFFPAEIGATSVVGQHGHRDGAVLHGHSGLEANQDVRASAFVRRVRGQKARGEPRRHMQLQTTRNVRRLASEHVCSNAR